MGLCDAFYYTTLNSYELPWFSEFGLEPNLNFGIKPEKLLDNENKPFLKFQFSTSILVKNRPGSILNKIVNILLKTF